MVYIRFEHFSRAIPGKFPCTNDIELHFQNDMIDELGEHTKTQRSLRRRNGKNTMIICQCNGVSDRAIRKAIREGASNRNDIVRTCKAGKACGGCVPAIDEIIEAEQERIQFSGVTVLELATG